MSDKETLVLLPGMMCTAELFSPQIAAFEKDYQIVVPSLTKDSVVGMAEAVLSEVEADSFNVAGLSMGGIVAMAMVGLAPKRIKRLALLDTNHLADASERYDIRNRQIEDVRHGKLREVIIDEMKPAYLAEKNRNNQQLLDLLVEMAISCGPEAFINQSIALCDRVDSSEALKNYSGPTLVLCGEKDTLCPPERHKEMCSLLSNATLEVVCDAGHISTLEAPEVVNTALRAWLEMEVI